MVQNEINVQTLVAQLRPPVKAAMLFGSVARGSSTEESDVDVLQLAPQPTPSYKVGRLTVSVYAASALREMAEQGSLFVLHLKIEGQILFDPEDVLRALLECYHRPESYDPLLSNLRDLACLLDVSEEKYSEMWQGLNKMSVFILRSALFAKFADEGRPCFSMSTIAEMLGNQEVLTAYKLKNCASPNYQLFAKTKHLIELYLDFTICNPYGSYEALLLKQSRQNDFLKYVGLHFLKQSTTVEAYDFLKSQANGA